MATGDIVTVSFLNYYYIMVVVVVVLVVVVKEPML